jgi:ABC-type nitrate/sulfonate/bicarbonate transport system substrate-binding protein
MIGRKLCALFAAAAAASVIGLGSPAQAQTKLKVMVFPSWSNLPLFAAEAQGSFAKRGLAVEVLNTPNSEVLREGLAKGDHQIVHAGVDNAVAQVEVAKVDVSIVLGGDGGLQQLFVQPEIKSYADLRGKTVIVDAPNTAFALLLYKMLEVNGLKKGDYQVKPVGGTSQRMQAMQNDKSNAAAILNPPFSLRAEKEGLKSLGSAFDVIGPYQSTGAWVLRSWGQANADTLVKYIQAYVEGMRWTLDPAQGGRHRAVVGAAETAPGPGGTHLRDGARPRRLCQGRQVRRGRFQERAEAARRHPRHLGRHAPGARQVSRHVVLPARADRELTSHGETFASPAEGPDSGEQPGHAIRKAELTFLSSLRTGLPECRRRPHP